MLGQFIRLDPLEHHLSGVGKLLTRLASEVDFVVPNDYEQRLALFEAE